MSNETGTVVAVVDCTVTDEETACLALEGCVFWSGGRNN